MGSCLIGHMEVRHSLLYYELLIELMPLSLATIVIHAKAHCVLMQIIIHTSSVYTSVLHTTLMLHAHTCMCIK